MLQEIPPAAETACEAVQAMPDRSKQQGTDRYLSRGRTSPEAHGIIGLHTSPCGLGQPCIVTPGSGCSHTGNHTDLCYKEANTPCAQGHVSAASGGGGLGPSWYASSDWLQHS